MDNELLEKLQQLVKDNYRSYKCGWSYQRSEGNYYDCFEDGQGNGESWLAYQVGCLIGMELEEPDEQEDEE